MQDVLLNEGSLKNFGGLLKRAAVIGFLAVLPFTLLELAFNPISRIKAADFIALFGFLWLLATTLIVVVAPLMQALRTGHSMMARPVNLVWRVALTGLILTLWVNLVVDQMPCFLGVPNCD